MSKGDQGTTELVLQSKNITGCFELSPDPGGRLLWDCCCLLWGEAASTGLAQSWEGFAVGLQQEDLHGAVVTGLSLLIWAWAPGLPPAAVPSPLLLRSSYMHKGCVLICSTLAYPMIQVFRVLTTVASWTLSFRYQNLVKMQGLNSEINPLLWY